MPEELPESDLPAADRARTRLWEAQAICKTARDAKWDEGGDLTEYNLFGVLARLLEEAIEEINQIDNGLTPVKVTEEPS